MCSTVAWGEEGELRRYRAFCWLREEKHAILDCYLISSEPGSHTTRSRWRRDDAHREEEPGEICMYSMYSMYSLTSGIERTERCTDDMHSVYIKAVVYNYQETEQVGRGTQGYQTTLREL